MPVRKTAVIVMAALVALVAIGVLVSGKALLLVWLLVPIAGLSLAFLSDLLSIVFGTASPNPEPPVDESMEEHLEHYRYYGPR